MNTILTKVTFDKKTRKRFIVAITASGKTTKRHATHSVNEHDHKQVAVTLSVRMGWGFELIGGETKDGFAYIPFKPSPEPISLTDVKSASEVLVRAASAFSNGGIDPIRLAAGIMDLIKRK